MKAYANPDGLAVDGWLAQAAPDLLAGATSEPATVAGQAAVQVCATAQFAGGCTLYMTHGQDVLGLTPVGPEGNAVLQSLTLE